MNILNRTDTRVRGPALRGVLAAMAGAALFLVSLLSPGTSQAASFSLTSISEIRFVTTDLCNMGMLGTKITDTELMSFASPKFVNITDVGRCISGRPGGAPLPANPPNPDVQMGSELFNYATVGTSTGYGTRLTALVTNMQTAPFNMMVVSTGPSPSTGAAPSGEVQVGSEVFTYDSKMSNSFHITARAQRGTSAANHNATGPASERVYATPASGLTSSIQTTPTSAISDIGVPATITVADATGAAGAGANECSGTAPPCELLIDDERFTYTSRTGNTFTITGRGTSKSTAVAHTTSSRVLAPRATPFDLEVSDAGAEAPFDAGATNGPSGTSHFICLVAETLEYNPMDAATVGDGLSGASDVLHITARAQDRLVGQEECGLITPRVLQGQQHVGTGIRDATRVQLLDRALPEYDGGTATTAAQHAGDGSVAITSPPSFNRCISRADRMMQGGPDPVTTRTRCYSRLINQPSPPPPQYFVSTDPLLDPLTFHQVSIGTFNDETNGVLDAKLQILGMFVCLPASTLHIEVRTTFDIDKTAGDTDYGKFKIRVWTNDPACGGTGQSPNYIVGACDQLPLPAPQTVTGSCATTGDGTNARITPLADNVDTDAPAAAAAGVIEGCTDFKELGPDETLGGDRDPFNPYDFYDTNGNQVVDLPTDIFGVAQAFDQGPNSGNPSPNYTSAKDRGARLGPFSWNRAGPDGIITLPDDIFAAASQFDHSCA